MQPTIKRTAIILLLSFLMVSSGCGVFKKKPDKHVKTSEASSANYERYSRALGYELEGNENILLLEEVASWLGVPYKYGGCTRKGTDCSCLIGNIYSNIYGIKLPRRSIDIASRSKKINLKNLKEADLLFFKTSGNKVSHVGLHISKGYFVHASSSKGVMINHITDNYYKRTFAFAGRIK